MIKKNGVGTFITYFIWSVTRLFISTLFLVTVLQGINIQAALAQEGADHVLELWPDGAPGAKGTLERDKPTLTVFLPEQSKATGTGILVFPGGGYAGLAMEDPGYTGAKWLNSLGIAAFVVKYRLGRRYHHPAQLNDAQRAVQIVRENAEDWKLDRDKIGVMGFSAGGHLASTVGTHFEEVDIYINESSERYSSRPDFMILVYPLITMKDNYTNRFALRHLLGKDPSPNLITSLSNETQVTSKTPPTFIVHGSNDDVVPVQNSVQFYLALKEHNVPAEMHIYEDAPHGFKLGFHDPVLSSWTKLCVLWLESKGFLPK